MLCDFDRKERKENRVRLGVGGCERVEVSEVGAQVLQDTVSMGQCQRGKRTYIELLIVAVSSLFLANTFPTLLPHEPPLDKGARPMKLLVLLSNPRNTLANPNLTSQLRYISVASAPIPKKKNTKYPQTMRTQ